ncbi:hypothetical protein HanPSC8_Chr13g0577181 [Helianthus annuus]|nr:hypothetical protein HanPSC8_Chr13g0577181 [Helianthus annuus]
MGQIKNSGKSPSYYHSSFNKSCDNIFIKNQRAGIGNAIKGNTKKVHHCGSLFNSCFSVFRVSIGILTSVYIFHYQI